MLIELGSALWALRSVHISVVRSAIITPRTMVVERDFEPTRRGFCPDPLFGEGLSFFRRIDINC